MGNTRSKSSLRVWFLILPSCLALIAAWFGCDRSGTQTPSGIAVTVLDLRQAVDTDGERFAGRASPITTVQVRSQVEGAVQDLAQIDDPMGNPHRLQIGDSVATGEFLVQIDPQSYQERLGAEQAKLESARVQAANARIEYQRTKALYESEVDSKESLDNARTAYESARASQAQQQHSVDQAKIQLSRTRIESPLDGVVLKVMVVEGDTVRPQSILLEIGDISSLNITFGVPAQSVGILEMGMLLHMTFDALAETDYAAPITKIAPSADTRSGVFDVTLTLPNPGEVIRPGFVAEVRVPRELLEQATGPRMTIPLDSVVRPPEEPAGFGVYIVVETESQDGKIEQRAQIRPVELGAPIGNRVSVLSGLWGDEQVIVRGATLVHEGSVVRVIP